MSPTINRSSAILGFECSNATKIPGHVLWFPKDFNQPQIHCVSFLLGFLHETATYYLKYAQSTFLRKMIASFKLKTIT